MPLSVSLKSFAMTRLGIRMQPFETAFPIDHGALVP